MTSQRPAAGARRRAVVATILLSGIVVALTVAVLAHPAPFDVDTRWAEAVIRMRSGILTFFAADVLDLIGRFPYYLIIVAVVAFLLYRTRTRTAVVVFVAAEAMSATTNVLMKAGVDRPRPPDGLVEATASSFPSGHSAFAAVTAVLVAGMFTHRGGRAGWVILAVTLALVMAWSRTYLMVHWLTDVAGGLAAGIAIGLGGLAYLGSRSHHTSAAAPRQPEPDEAD